MITSTNKNVRWFEFRHYLLYELGCLSPYAWLLSNFYTFIVKITGVMKITSLAKMQGSRI
ncbi:hypothetical protein C8B47_18685 [filamentous cyanobacterium CCP4]|nr:hypothetical protein C8B47_18685 [filamentous cyanobacterium CCP4]